MNLAPVVLRPSEYTDEERAVIAGYLLRQRHGTLAALSSSERGAVITSDIGQEQQRRYYQICEAYSRFLLYWIGYAVNKNKMYGEP
jgi:hypothetical protein